MKLFLLLSLFAFVLSCAQTSKEPTNQVNKNEKKFEIYNPGFTAGTLKIVKARDVESGAYISQADDILILDRLPQSINLVRGLIISKPASGDNVETVQVSKALSIPLVYIAKAEKSEQFKKLENKKVFFKPKVDSEDFSLLEISDEVFIKFDTALKTRFPKINLEVDQEVLSTKRKFSDLSSEAVDSASDMCGHKPANLIEAQGFCIPFYYFETFMKMNKRGSLNLREFILKQFESLGDTPKAEEVKAVTDRIQQVFNEAKMSERHLEDIKRRFLSAFNEEPSKTTFTLRASNNTESDRRLYMFTGSTAEMVSLRKLKSMRLSKLEKIIKSLWSSNYNFKSYLIRRKFEVDEAKLNSSVLVYKSLPATIEPANDASLEAPVFEEPILMLDREQLLTSVLAAPEYGPIGLTTKATYKLDIPLGSSFSDLKENFKEAEIQISDFIDLDQKIKITNMNRVFEGPWVRDSKDKRRETKIYRLFFETNHAFFNDLNMAISYTAVRSNGQISSDNIVTLDKAKIERLVNRNHYSYWLWKSSKNLGSKENKRYVLAELRASEEAGAPEKVENPESKAYCYQGKKIAVLGRLENEDSAEQAKFFKDLEPLSLEKDLIVKQEFRISETNVSAETKNSLYSKQYAVYLEDENFKKSVFEKTRFIVFTEYSASANNYLSTYDIKMKRLSKVKLDQDCEPAIESKSL